MMYFSGKKIFYYVLILSLFFVVFGAGFLVGKNQVVCQVCKPEQVDFSLFWDAYNKLQGEYINPEAINNQKIIYGAISGMARSLGDPYTEFLDPEQSKAFNQDLSGSFEGIGIEIGLKKGQLTVIAPLEGTPAEKAGLKSGDQIVKIDDKNTYDISIGEAVGLIRGKKGTKVTLTIFREGWSNTKDIQITRGTIKVDSVKWELKDNDIAYIHITQFDQPLSADFKNISFEILKSPAKKIILDLRDNPGGYLEVSNQIAGWFLKEGSVVTIEDFGKNKEQVIYKAEGNETFVNYPMVVLINEGSASAAEILAGALKDNRDIKLIGEKSFGKGSVQKVVTLQDKVSLLKITIAKWLTPSGISISDVGLTPDIKVEITEEDFEADKDPQLDKALEIVKGLK